MFFLDQQVYESFSQYPFDYDVFVLSQTNFLVAIVSSSTIILKSFQDQNEYHDLTTIDIDNIKEDRVQDIFLCCQFKTIKNTLFLLIGCQSGTVLCIDCVSLKIQITQVHQNPLIQILSIRNTPIFLTLASDNFIYENHLKITKLNSKVKFIDKKNILQKITRIDYNEEYLLCGQDSSNIIIVDMYTNKEVMRINNVFQLGISDIKFFNKNTIIALSIDGNFGLFKIDFDVLQKAKFCNFNYEDFSYDYRISFFKTKNLFIIPSNKKEVFVGYIEQGEIKGENQQIEFQNVTEVQNKLDQSITYKSYPIQEVIIFEDKCILKDYRLLEIGKVDLNY